MLQYVAGKLPVQTCVGPSSDWKSLSVNPAVNGYIFESGISNEGLGSKRRGMDPAFHYALPKI